MKQLEKSLAAFWLWLASNSPRWRMALVVSVGSLLVVLTVGLATAAVERSEPRGSARAPQALLDPASAVESPGLCSGQGAPAGMPYPE